MDEKKLIEIDGVKFYVPNPNDFIYADMIRNNKLWDIDRIKYMMRFIAFDSIAIDAGSHVGCHTIQFARKAKTVIAVEPIKQNFDLWQANIELNGLTNCRVVKKALSNKTGGKLIIDPERERLQTNSGATFLISSKQGEIETVTLDSLLYEQERVSLIKYDVEEMELEALQGSKEILKKHKPALYVEILKESHRCSRKKNGNQIIRFLNSFGYIKTKAIGVWVNKDNQKHIGLI